MSGGDRPPTRRRSADRPPVERPIDRQPFDRPLGRFLTPSHGIVLAELRLRTRARAARTARRWVAEVATEWDAAHVTEDLELCTSELVTNVYRHAPGLPDSTLRLLVVRNGTLLWVEVHDGERAGPRLRHASPDEETGRGLFLVERVADDHGTYPTATGKVTWFALSAWSRATGPATEARSDGRP